jgi:hypothetical protein
VPPNELHAATIATPGRSGLVVGAPQARSAPRGWPLIRDRDTRTGGDCDSLADAASLFLARMRRADPGRTYEAQRQGLRNRLRDGWQMSEDLADAVVEEWDLIATTRGLGRRQPAYWSEAEKWLEERFPSGRARLS